MSCHRPPKTYEEQLQILKSRGLIVHEASKALHCLEHHNYYRLSAYRFPLTVLGNPDQFLPGTTFDDLWNLYHFDRTLRQFAAEAVKRVEISVRSRWSYVLAHLYGPQAYEDSSVFHNSVRHKDMLQRLDEEMARSHEDFIAHYKTKYRTLRPPIWAASEVLTFGLLSRFYENIKRNKDCKQISTTYSMSPETLESLLQHCAYIRNLCAHHSRLWNRRFTITLQLPRSSPRAVLPNLNPAQDRLIYNTLVLLTHMLGVIEPASTWSRRLVGQLLLLDSRFLPHMGFPNDWQHRPLWRDLVPHP
jgi:abortive infection bacteriophage resistance protein